MEGRTHGYLNEAQQPSASGPVGRVPKRKRTFFIIGLITVLLSISTIAASYKWMRSTSANSNIVPTAISQQSPFPIYYPDPQKLPQGYVLDGHSFSENDQTVIYSVSYPIDRKIAFTVQPKPTEDEIKSFYATHIPLHTDVSTAVGTAAVGILNNQTFASLPTNSNAWILITAPPDLNQDQLKKILHAIKRE